MSESHKTHIFDDSDLDRFTLTDMHVLDVPKMIESLMVFQQKFILAENDIERDKIKHDWESLALSAAELAETNDDLQRIDAFSPMGSQAKLLVSKKLDSTDGIAA
ncbi:MAG: hypothetical protein WA051_01190 [Minisyncoccia bacterium]